jgi:deoxyadenosine/deoxycytidine kinase
MIYKSLLILFSSLIFFIEANTLIVIQGTANCGKSTLCKALNRLDNSYKIISQDDINRKATYEVCENVFPAEMAIIRKTINYENMWQAVKCGNVIYKSEVNEKEKQITIHAINQIRTFFDDPLHYKYWMSISKRIKHRVMEQLLLYAAAGSNIILDSWGVTNWDHELEEINDCFDQIIKVVTYCSLETVTKRWKKRNADAIQTNNHEDQRFLSQMLKSFFGFLEPALIDQNGILTVTKKDFDELMEKATQYIANIEHKNYPETLAFSFQEFTTEELIDFKEKMYIKFDFENLEEVKLIPSASYDMVLCTEGEYNGYADALLKTITEKTI